MKSLTPLALAVVIAVAGCASGPRLSDKMRLDLQTKQFDGVTPDTLTRAFETALQQEGYSVTQRDLERGVLAARRQDPTGRVEVFLDWDSQASGGISARLTFQRQEPFDLESERGEEILYDLPYLRIYLKVRAALDGNRHGT